MIITMPERNTGLCTPAGTKTINNMGHFLMADERLKKFVTTSREMDQLNAERTFTGRMTKRRYMLLSRYCRRNSYRGGCAHDYDCCGCLVYQFMTFEYKFNQVTITLIQTFNY